MRGRNGEDRWRREKNKEEEGQRGTGGLRERDGSRLMERGATTLATARWVKAALPMVPRRNDPRRGRAR